MGLVIYNILWYYRRDTVAVMFVDDIFISLTDYYVVLNDVTLFIQYTYSWCETIGVDRTHTINIDASYDTTIDIDTILLHIGPDYNQCLYLVHTNIRNT